MTPFPPIPPEDITNGQIYAAIMTLAGKTGVASDAIHALKEEFDDYKHGLEELLSAWRFICTAARVTKQLLLIGVPATILWGIFKLWIISHQ